jgi:beta-N-acetylhexosaminidase
MSPPLAPQPALATLVSSGTDQSLESRARAYGVAQGQGLADIGVNMNFGPVVDLMPHGDKLMFDTHTLLGKRAISSDPVVVTRVASAYADGLISQGVRPTLKHFPGLARVTVDTHHVAGRIMAARRDLAASDWRPFRALSSSGAALMVGHVVLNDIDPTTPASLSGAVIQGVLRQEWGFQGLIVTDDLNMGAVYRLGVGQAACAALKAGVDLVLVSYDPDQYYRAMISAVAAYRANQLDDAQLLASKHRLDQALRTGLGERSGRPG